MSTGFNRFLNSLYGQLQFKTFSKLTEKSGQNISLDYLTKGNEKIILLIPSDLVFSSLDEDVCSRLAKLDKNKLKELINLHIIQKIDNNNLFINVLGDKYILKDDTINGIKFVNNTFKIGNIIIIPMTSIIVNDNIRKLLTQPDKPIVSSKQEQISQLLQLPINLLRIVALKLNGNELLNLCSVNKELNIKLCSNETFWLEKVRLDFPNEANIKFKPRESTWKEYYKRINLLGKSKSYRKKNSVIANPFETISYGNNGYGFKVIINDKGIFIYEQITSDDDEWEENFIFELVYWKTKPSYHTNEYLGFWPGIDNSKMYGNFNGTAILIEIGHMRYLYIDSYNVIIFETDDFIYDFYSPMGNSSAPYPIAFGINHIYFLSFGEYLSREDLLTEGIPENIQDLLMEYIDGDPDRKHMLDQYSLKHVVNRQSFKINKTRIILQNY